MKAFDQFSYEDAAALFTKDRRPHAAVRARKFFDGDHWQDEWGYAGELPPHGYEGRHFIIENLRHSFTFENVVFEITDAHVGGVLGTEPMWDFTRNGKNLRADKNFTLGETLTAHWDEREHLQTLNEAAEGLVLEGLSVLHLYFPAGLLKDDGTIKDASTVADALDYLYCEVLTSDVAGVFVDPATKKQVGVYLFEEGEDEKVKKADVCYLDDNKKTILRRLTQGEDASDDFGPYDLGGHLFLHELKRRPLITDAVQTGQKSLNLAHTMMSRNVSLAGNRQTDIVNGRVPSETTRAVVSPPSKLADEPHGKKGKVYKRNPGWVNEIWGLPIYNEAGSKIIGYTQPTINVSEPVPVETFQQTRESYYEAMLGQAFMLHLLISGDATASGRSREQARKEYERSLSKTAIPLNAGGRWLLEAEVRMAAELAKDRSVRDLRAVFQCNVEKVPISASERQENRADLEAGILDPEEVMRRAGVEDTGAMIKKVEAYQKKKAKLQPPTQPPSSQVEDKTGQGAIA